MLSIFRYYLSLEKSVVFYLQKPDSSLECFVPDLVEISPLVREKFFECLLCIYGVTLLLNKLKFPLSKDVVCQFG